MVNEGSLICLLFTLNLPAGRQALIIAAPAAYRFSSIACIPVRT